MSYWDRLDYLNVDSLYNRRIKIDLYVCIREFITREFLQPKQSRVIYC